TEKEVLLCDTDKAIPTPIYTI
ncbi:hypothetical protein QUD63_22190, partial [Staphylococcus aureus]